MKAGAVFLFVVGVVGLALAIQLVKKLVRQMRNP